MANGAYSPASTVVLTTHERYSYFSAALGDGIDAHFNPKDEPPLEDLLHNIIIARGKLVIVDEAFFISPDDMALGLERYFSSEEHFERLEIIVVCSQRYPGDRLLAFLVMYCGIYNIVFGKQGAEISLELEHLLRQPNTRREVLPLIECEKWSRRDQARANLEPRGPLRGPTISTFTEPRTPESNRGTLLINANERNILNIQVEIKSI